MGESSDEIEGCRVEEFEKGSEGVIYEEGDWVLDFDGEGFEEEGEETREETVKKVESVRSVAIVPVLKVVEA